MRTLRMVAALTVLALGACDRPTTTGVDNEAVRELGNVPVADLGQRIPKTLVACFGSHYALVTADDHGEDKAPIAEDLQLFCRWAAAESRGACRVYATAAMEFGRQVEAGGDTVKAEAKAAKALKACAR